MKQEGVGFLVSALPIGKSFRDHLNGEGGEQPVGHSLKKVWEGERRGNWANLFRVRLTYIRLRELVTS